jgi:hypothetical protein
MSRIQIDEVTPGLRDSEAVASFTDYQGRKHFIRVERDFLVTQDGTAYLPVATITIDKDTGAHLIELPHEAETGANRLWMKAEAVDALEAVA